ncbi:MAG: hypothetical protein WC600_14990 [Desulfobaccales bacterium]
MAWQYVENVRIRFILTGLVTLMLLVSMASAQSVRGDAPQDLLPQPPCLEKSIRPPDRPSVADESAIGTNFGTEPAASHRFQATSLSPLPPASAFALQADLRKFLDTWPTPGTTVARNEPPDGELTDEDLM